MRIRVCTDKLQWESQYKPLNQAEFLQSWEWGVFQESVGNVVMRLQLTDQDRVVWQGQGIVYRLGLGLAFVYFPRVMMCSSMEIIRDFLKKQGLVFARFEPCASLSKESVDENPTHNRQPKETLVLDLGKTEDELLAEMHSKTRYNIRLATRKGVEIRREPNINVFWVLHEQTTTRDAFSGHTRVYYEQMLAMDVCEQFTAYYEGRAIATTLCMIGPDRYVYLHGASSNEARNVMAPYLLQWTQIQHAKQLGLSRYDFWGVSPSSDGVKQTSFHTLSWDASHAWTGVTRFKAGFGGERSVYPAAFEISIRPFLYRLYRFFHVIRTR